MFGNDVEKLMVGKNRKLETFPFPFSLFFLGEILFDFLFFYYLKQTLQLLFQAIIVEIEINWSIFNFKNTIH